MDKLLDPADIEDDDSDEELEEPVEGLRRRTLEYRFFGVDTTNRGGGTENGVVFRGEQQTLEYGDFVLDAAASTSTGEPLLGIRSDDGLDFTLAQYGLPLAAGWSADNILGVTRSQIDPALAIGYRVTLPSSILAGLRSSAESDEGALRFTYGKIGALLGRSTFTFDATSGTLAGLGYSQSLGSGWRLGGQFYDLQGNDRVRDHQTLVGLVEKQSADGRGLLQGRIMGDSESKFGGWLDAVEHRDLWIHRFGGFYLEPDLLWTNVDVNNDQAGVYWRSDRSALRGNLSLGIDHGETNVENERARRGTRDTIGFASGTLRLNRRSNVGGTLRLSRRSGKKGFLGGTGNGVDVTAFTNQELGATHNRFRVRAVDLPDTEDSRSRAWTLNWDGRWTVDRDRDMTAFLEWGRGDDSSGKTTNWSAGLGWRQQIGASFGWSGNLTYNQRNSPGSQIVRSPRVNIAAYWQISRNWRLDARIDLDRNNFSGPSASQDFDENTFYLTFSYDRASGRPFGKFGAGSGATEVAGIVFFDENADEIRQPTEDVARRIPVILDGRYTTVTDSNGRFSFFPVSSGQHQLQLALEDVPLPWTLANEDPQRLDVGVRGTTTQNFPLIRSDQ